MTVAGAYVHVYGSAAIAIRTMTGVRRDFEFQLNETERLIVLQPQPPSGEAQTWRYGKPDANYLTVEGKLDGDDFRVQLRKLNSNDFLLMNRGFRWINDAPINQ